MFRRRRKYHRQPLWRWFPRTAVALRWAGKLALMLFVVDLFYLSTIWPDWKGLSAGPIPKSNFIRQYEQGRKQHGWRRPRWRPLSLNLIPSHVIRAVVVAEDSRFYEHEGFDLIAFKEAMDYNLSSGRFRFGASTISQQTVKNLFLSASRNPVRKWHELLLTWGMEKNISKRRILEIYVNIAEFGRGIYGVEAASRAYWNVPVSRLNLRQAAELAASLPNPKKSNPEQRDKAFERRTKKIFYWLTRVAEEADR